MASASEHHKLSCSLHAISCVAQRFSLIPGIFPLLHFFSVFTKLDKEAESEDEGKMNEVTGSGELLSLVQELEDKLKDYEQEKMALQNKLKTRQEEDSRARQEIASLKEKLGSVLSSQVRGLEGLRH